MATSLNEYGNWIFRVKERILVNILSIDKRTRKITLRDPRRSLPISVDISKNISLTNLLVGKEYLVNLKIYTSKDLQDVDGDFISFFEEVDVDQSIDNFIKAYWIYPTKIKFKVESIEPVGGSS